MFLMLLVAMAADPTTPTIRIVESKSVEVSGLPESFKHKTLDDWEAALRVTVDGNKNDFAIIGTYSLVDGTLKFVPRFPFEPGVKYRATFKHDSKESIHEFTIPRTRTEPAVVRMIYPSADTLPENTLRFYIHFSKPMSKGDIYKYVTLTNDTDKKTVELPFLELEEELWSIDQKRITLFIDPGRIKREVKPREDLGPTLEAGKTFTLTVSKDWRDAEGEPLKDAYRKTFKVGEPIRDAIDPEKWTIAAPKAGSKDPLRITLGRAIDSALLERLIWLETASGQKLEGTITHAKHETVWEFTPKAAWTAGNYTLQIATHLEDTSGNRVGEPFEVDLLKPVGPAISTETVSRTITIK